MPHRTRDYDQRETLARPDAPVPTRRPQIIHPLTPRDHFAMAALTAIGNSDFFGRLSSSRDGSDPWQTVAESAYELADAMLIERNKRP